MIFRLEYVQMLDEVLELFETEPRFQHFVLNGEVGPLENYLSIRPQNFERIEQLVEDGKLLIGPWYALPYDSAEMAVRSLMLGLRTADVFGRPMMVGYMPYTNRLPGYLPQIFKAFGIEVAISDCIDPNKSSELSWIGDDGTQIILAQLQKGTIPLAQSIAELRAGAALYSESGQLLLPYEWGMNQLRAERLELLGAIPATQKASHDKVFHSHPAAYAKAIQTYAQTHPLPIIYSGSTAENDDPGEFALTRLLEPLVAWAAALETLETDEFIRRPQYLLQQLWKRYLNGEEWDKIEDDCDDLAMRVLGDIAQHINMSKAQGTIFVVFNGDHVPVEFESNVVLPLGFNIMSYGSLFGSGRVEVIDKIVTAGTDAIHEGSLSPSMQLVTTPEPQFRITAAKLPEDPEREGLLVRGYNNSDEDVWVTLTPWRAYEIIDVVTMAEEPTGGRLAQESNGAIRFKAALHRILTFWFHD